MAEIAPYIPDVLFPTDNGAEIPMLRLDMQPEFCEIPFVCFGEQKRTYKMNGAGTLHFYTDDYRYTQVYDHPGQILNHQPGQIVEPNFSLFNEMPTAFALQSIYKKRWIARMMQEKGIPVFVDLNVASKFYKLNMLGVPLGYHAFCTRGYSDRLQYLEFEYNLAKSWAGDNKLLFVIYNGGWRCKRFAAEHSCVYVSPMVTVKKDLKKAAEAITSNVAFLGKEFGELLDLPETQKHIAERQMSDFTNRLKIEEKHE